MKKFFATGSGSKVGIVGRESVFKKFKHSYLRLRYIAKTYYFRNKPKVFCFFVSDYAHKLTTHSLSTTSTSIAY